MPAKDNETSAAGLQPGQSKRPPLNHRVSETHDSDSQVSDHATQSHHRPKHQKHNGRLHARNLSAKALPKHTTSTAKLSQKEQHRRFKSPSPERLQRPMLSSAHRRTTSDVRLQRDSSATNLKNSSHTNLKRNRSHVEVGKRSKSGANIKRSSSHKDLVKHKAAAKGQVHFDLGNDGNDEGEWVDASGSASPYLSRRGSIISSGQSSGKVPASGEMSHRPHTPPQVQPDEAHEETRGRRDHNTAQHNINLTSRLLQRTPFHGAPPKMSTETAQARPQSVSPDSGLSRTSSTLYGTPKTTKSLTGGTLMEGVSNQDELTSRFMEGIGSGVNPESGSFYSPTRPPANLLERERERDHMRIRRPQSLGNLHREHRDSITDDPDDEDDSALAPRRRRSMHRAPPAETSRTQQKLNLQRASSSMEPVQAGGGVGAVGVNLMVGGAAYDRRDPRVEKLIERTGMEYLVVRRFQNPVAKSIARLHQLPGADKRLPIPKQNGRGINGNAHTTPRSHGRSASLAGSQRSRPMTPRRGTSIRTNGANSSLEGEDDNRDYEAADDGGVSAILRNLWDKNSILSASSD